MPGVPAEMIKFEIGDTVWYQWMKYNVSLKKSEPEGEPREAIVIGLSKILIGFGYIIKLLDNGEEMEISEWCLSIRRTITKNCPEYLRK